MGWTKEIDALLRATYPTQGSAPVMRATGYSRSKVKHRAAKLGVYMAERAEARPWTLVEDSLIRQMFPHGGTSAVALVMPDRTESAITARAFRLGAHHVASPFSHPAKANEAPWPVPAHDYADEDRAWMATRLPVFGGGFGAARISA